ncbi:hypothetical protein DFH28DRAFT_1081911 [Melampsora americana]|nr:hypothetical protein DFH28DRAFT_1081911 [Melampsora americana]
MAHHHASSPSTSNVSEATFVCHGVDGKYASGHRKQRLKRCPNQLCQQCCRSSGQTCSHHRSQFPPSASLTAPITSKARDSAHEVDNHVLSEQPRSRVINRTVNPQADRHAIRDLPREAVAHHNAARQRTQAAKDKVDLHELTLRVWLKAGEALEIPVTALNFPRYALIESRALQRVAHGLLGPSWDLELEVLRPGSLKWQLVDANIPLMYPLHTTEILIRKMGLPVESCLGIDSAPHSLKNNAQTQSLNIQHLLEPDVSHGIWGGSQRGVTNVASTSKIEIDPDSDVEIVGSLKRKKEDDEDIESSPLARKKARKLQPFLGSTCKLSELLVWCSKAPKTSAKGVAKEAWHEIFGDRFKTDPMMKTAYGYRTWALDREEELREWIKGKEDVTVDKAYRTFRPAILIE